MTSTPSAAAEAAAETAGDVRFVARWNEAQRGFGIWDALTHRWASAPTFESERVADVVAGAFESRRRVPPPDAPASSPPS